MKKATELKILKNLMQMASSSQEKNPTFLVNNIFSDFSSIELTQWVRLNRLFKKFYENKGHMSEDFVADTAATDESIHILFNRD